MPLVGREAVLGKGDVGSLLGEEGRKRLLELMTYGWRIGAFGVGMSACGYGL